MTIPVLVTPTWQQLAQPYLTAAQFTAYPHWLDLDDLIPGGVATVQEDVLADVLLQASQWCVSMCEGMPLHGHWVQNENQVVAATRSGRVAVRPRHIPLRAITALSYGYDPTAMTADSLPDASMWIEDGRRVSFLPGGALAFLGPALQFGTGPSPGQVTYLTWSYVAGYPSTTLEALESAGATSLTLTDPAGVLPGDVLRIYDPDTSEAVTVASTYVPATPTVPPTATAVPLAAPLVNAHAAGTGVTGMPRDILQAVICYAVSMLMREDVADEVPQSRFGTASRATAAARGGAAGGLINDAEQLLGPYRPSYRTPGAS